MLILPHPEFIGVMNYVCRALKSVEKAYQNYSSKKPQNLPGWSKPPWFALKNVSGGIHDIGPERSLSNPINANQVLRSSDNPIIIKEGKWDYLASMETEESKVEILKEMQKGKGNGVSNGTNNDVVTFCVNV